MAMMMFAGINAQPRQGKGSGPAGQGYGHGPGYGPYAQADSDFIPGARTGQNLYLDLTEAQQEQWKALRLGHYKVMKPLRNQMAELKTRERTLISEEEVDMKALHKVIDDQSNLMNKMHKLRLEQRLAVREILTEEQLMRLDQRRGQGRMGHGKMGHGQMGHGKMGHGQMGHGQMGHGQMGHGNRFNGPQCEGGPYHMYHRNRR